MALSVVVTGVGAERKEVEALAISKDVKKSSNLNVDYHTKDEIISFIMSHPVSEGYKTEYKKEPSTSSPYEAGRLSDKTKSKLGKRTPFILIGSIATAFVLPFSFLSI